MIRISCSRGTARFPESIFRGLLCAIIACLLLTGSSPAGRAAADDPLHDESPTLRCGTLPGDFNLDGRLDEPAWAAADAVDNITMIDPVEGGVPTGRTVIRVLADAKTIVIGIDCEDPDPSGIVSYSVARDSGLRDEDHVKIVFDTYGDGRNGFVFAVNPSGARYDGLVAGRGEYENRNWDGIWEAKTARHQAGWSAEIRLPISTLTFKEGLDAWGFNVQRRIQRLLETSRWANPRRDFKVTHTRHAGRLVGLPDFDLGVGLSVRPALVTGFEKPSRDEDRDLDSELSLDVTQKLGPNLLSLLTINTDFAETEVDSFRTNLTRFPLFFPEKRSFFLEGNEVFDFGLGINHEAMPFHSRRIGLVDGEEVPLAFGAKVYGQVGDTNIGALGVNMGDESDVAPETNMGVVRVSQNIFEESSVGFIATRGDPTGRHGAWTFGTDFVYQSSDFLGDKNFLAGFWGITCDRDDIEGDRRSAAGFKIDYPNDLWDMAVMYKRIGEDFDPSVGFVPRTGIDKYIVKAEYMPHSGLDFLRQTTHEVWASYVAGIGGPWESYRLSFSPVELEFESGDQVGINVSREGENLPEDFEISDDVTIVEEDYEWTRYSVGAETASKRTVAGEASWEFGRFYDGLLDTYEAELEWNPDPLVTIFLVGERNVVRLDQGSFTEDVYGSRFRFNFSPDMMLSSFLQWNTEEDAIGTNTRFQWTITPESNLYFILNYNWNKIDRHWKRESYKSQVKVEYTFRF